MKTNFLHKYILPRKKYNILSLTENRSEFLINEVYFFLNISIWHRHYLEDEHAGTPFSDYSRAQEKKVELEKIEKRKVLDREIFFVWISVAFLMGVIGNCLLRYIL